MGSDSEKCTFCSKKPVMGCEVCVRPICENHADRGLCNECSNELRHLCSDDFCWTTTQLTCHECGRYVCKEHRQRCSNCNERVCTNCLDRGLCLGCSRELRRVCKERDCNTTTTKTCAMCDEPLCNGCARSRASAYGRLCDYCDYTRDSWSD